VNEVKQSLNNKKVVSCLSMTYMLLCFISKSQLFTLKITQKLVNKKHLFAPNKIHKNDK